MSNRFKEFISQEGVGLSHKVVKDILERKRKSVIPRKIRMSFRRREGLVKRLIEERQCQQAQVILEEAFKGNNITESDANRMFQVLDRLEKPIEKFNQGGQLVSVTIVDFSNQDN
jgi:hypothetical protein